MTLRRSVVIKDFVPADLDSLRQVIHATIDTSYAGIYSPRAIAHFHGHHSDERVISRMCDGRVLVIARDGELLGTGSLVGDEIEGVFVRPDIQKSGLGAFVMDELEAIATSVGLRSVELSASLPSVGFYEHRDYHMLEARSVDVGEGERLDYWMARKCLRGES